MLAANKLNKKQNKKNNMTNLIKLFDQKSALPTK